MSSSGAAPLVAAVDTSGRLVVTQFTNSATAGTAGATPLQVAGYQIIDIGGFAYKVPYYNS